MKALKQLRKTLFWDADWKSLDEKEDAHFIIGRVLDLGNNIKHP